MADADTLQVGVPYGLLFQSVNCPLQLIFSFRPYKVVVLADPVRSMMKSSLLRCSQLLYMSEQAY